MAMQRKANTGGPGQGRNQIQNQRHTHIQNETQLRNQQQAFHQVQGLPPGAIMMQGQRPYMQQGHIAMTTRPMRANRTLYSSSPQGHAPIHTGFIPQQNMPYSVVSQEHFQPMMRPYITNMPQYPMPATQFQPSTFVPSNQGYYQGGMSQMYYVPTQQPTQPQQPQQPTQPPRSTLQTNNVKPKPKRSTNKIIIRDPKDNKDVTEEILSQGNATNGRSGDTPPLPSSTAQAESSAIQAQFAAQVAAAVGDKGKPGNEKKEDNIQLNEVNNVEQIEQTNVVQTEATHEKNGNGAINTDDDNFKDSQNDTTETQDKLNSLSDENRTESPKHMTDTTQLNQASPILQEINEQWKMTPENEKELQSKPKVIVLQANRETSIKNGASGVSEKPTEDLNNKLPDKEDNVSPMQENVDSNVSPTLDNVQNLDATVMNLDKVQNDFDSPKSLDKSEAEMNDNVETNIGCMKEADDKEVVANETESYKQDENGVLAQGKHTTSDKSLKEQPSEELPKTEKEVDTPDVQVAEQPPQETIKQLQQVDKQDNKQRQEDKETQADRQQQQPTETGKQQQQQQDNLKPQVEKQQYQVDKQQHQVDKQPQVEKKLPQVEEQQPQVDKQQPQVDKQQSQVEEQQPQVEKQQPEVEKQQPEVEKQQPEVEKQQPEVEKQQAEVEKQQAEVEKQQAEVEKQQPEVEKQQPEIEKPQPEVEKQQPEVEKEQPEVEKEQPEVEKEQPEVEKEQPQVDKQQHQQENVKPQEKQPQQLQKVTEPPKKKSSKQRLKDLKNKETGGDMMDAYTDKPPPQEPIIEEKVKPVEIIPEQSDKPLEDDLSWEDKGEKIGDEIKVEKENDTEPAASVEPLKLKYERDFLLQFQFMQVCTAKPAGLPNIEVVLDAPVPQNKGGGAPRSDFLPSYARQKSQGGGGRRDSRGKPAPRKIIAAAPQPPVVLKQSENRWLRPQEKERELTDEDKKSAELYRIVVAILNKLTPQKFKTLVEQITLLNIDTSERLEGVIDRIFEKAIGEPVFSEAYANMCRCLFTIKVVDVDGKDVSFRKLLLNRCQKEFQKEKEDERVLNEKTIEMETLSEEEKKLKKEEMDETLAKNKRRMLGNIKFIGELFKLKLLTENIMHDCIFKLLRAGDEESLESMCKLLFTIGKDLDSDKAKPRIEQYFDQINKIILTKKVSSRVTFMLRDVVDLRQNNWVPRREEHYNPKTIDQIHKEAHMEKMQEQRLAANLPAKDKQKKGGGQGGRDSPKPTASDGWITTGKRKPVTIDANKLKSMAKRANNEEISLGPSARFGQWGRGSSAGLTSSTPQEQEPQGNRFSALSSGDMPSNRPYDPRRPASAGSRPSSAGSQGSDRRQQTKSDRDRESALAAVRAITKPEKPQVAQPPPAPANQEKMEVKTSKEPKETAKEALNEDEVIKKTTAIIDEYANIQDLQEAITCFTDLHSPNLHHVFILTAVEHTYEMKASARHATGRLFCELLAQNKLSEEQLTTGFNNLLEVAPDNAIDYPRLWKYLAEIITPLILRGQLTLRHLKPLVVQHLLPCSKAAILLAEILLIAKDIKSESRASEIWTESEISWSDVLPAGSSIEEFLSRKNINFLLNYNNKDENELLRLLHTDPVKNDTVFAHIEKNFKEEKRKEAEFIRHLVTAVAESCIVNKDGKDGPECCKEKLRNRTDILRKYLDNNHTLELEALFVLQEIYVKYNKPKDMLSQFFNILYDEEVITEETFFAWKADDSRARQEAKGPAIQATSSFFEWLQSATVEGSEN